MRLALGFLLGIFVFYLCLILAKLKEEMED